MLSKLRSLLVCTIAVLAAATTLAQNTIHVPADQPTIQAGINAANNGDTVLVAPGKYYEQLNFNGKAITLVSSGGAANTIIDGSGTGTVVFMNSASSSQLAILDGFTIQHGYPNGVGGTYNYNYGGAVDADGNSIVRNNVIANNTSCGVDVLDGNVTVQNNHIFNNTGADTAGSDCRIDAYGILAHDNITIRTNINLLNNLIEQNQDGGIGIYNLDASTTVNIEQNTIRSNGLTQTFFDQGAGVSLGDFALANVVGNLITGNAGPGVSQFLNYAITLTNNTIYLNSLMYTPQYSYQGTEVQLGEVDTPATLSNNIVVGNQNSYPVVSCNSDPFYGTFNWDRNVVYNTITHTGSIPCFPDPTGTNLYVDPKLRNPAGGDYHLAAGSPAIDAGNNSAPLLTATDLDGNPRLQDATGTPCAIVDIGAYEYPGTINNCLTTETLTSSLNPSTYGVSVTFNVQLDAGSGTPTGTVQFNDGSTVLGVQTVSSTGTSSYSTGTLTVGTHPITATYQPTGIFTAATASLSQVVTGTPTSTTLTCSATPIYVDATTLLSAMVSSSGGTPTGSITFTDGTNTLGQIQLTNGDANLTYTGTVVGSHIITATYVPTGSFAASSATCNLSVLALPTTSILTVTPTTSTFGNPVTLTATVSPVTKPGPSVPTGTVTFYNGATSLNTATLSAGVATYTTSTLPGGPNNLTCAYNGSSIYAPSNCNTIPATITAAAATLTLTSSANPSFAASPVTFTAQLTANGQPAPAGTSITLTAAGQTFQLTTDTNGYAYVTAYTLVPGSYLVTAASAATPSLQSASASLTQIVIANPTTTTLAASPTPGELTQPVTLTATVIATTGTSNPTGIVKFYDGSTLLGTAATGTSTTTTTTATFLTSSLTLGQHSLTASYIPNIPSYLPSQSATLPFTVISQEFTFTAAQNPMSLGTRLTGTNILTLTSIGGFTAPITISCPPAMPPAATCSLSSHTVQLPANGTATTTLTITTEVTSGATFWTLLHPASSSSRRIALASSFPLTLLMLMGLRRRRIRRNGLHIALTLASLAIFTSTLSACAPGQTVSTYPGTYTVTLTASGTGQSSSTPTVHTLDLTLVVTPYVP